MTPPAETLVQHQTTQPDPAQPASPTTHARLSQLIHDHQTHQQPRLHKLWQYYRNPDTTGKLAQTQGLPPRLATDPPSPTADPTATRETVIENDIAWRIHALVDFMVGQPVRIRSQAQDRGLAQDIDAYLNDVFTEAGGPLFFQELILLGSIYGHVDILLDASADHLDLAPIPATRGIPDPHRQNLRQLHTYLLHHRTPNPNHQETSAPRWRTLLSSLSPQQPATHDEHTTLFTPELIARYHQPARTTTRRLLDAGPNPLGRIPVVHIQNLPQPLHWTGLSDVEPLIPLQDELNTRLSDRANRVTFQSFKMYLGKGIDSFNDRPVGPGQMWQTDNPDAAILEFGGDADSPSETAHIQDIRDALDKTSGVTPVAAGLVRGKVGNLSSENAIRIVLLGLTAKAERKRLLYGQGIARACELVLHAAHTFGQLHTEPADRRVQLLWPNPTPEPESTRLRNAQIKRELGVPRDQVLRELGYLDTPAPEL
ncbi:MAG: phage portal protein [Planctomycetota bacterium]